MCSSRSILSYNARLTIAEHHPFPVVLPPPLLAYRDGLSMPTELGPVELTLGLRVDVAVPVGVDVNDSAEGGLEVAAEEPYDVNRGKILVSDSDPVGDVIGDKVLLPGPGELVVELLLPLLLSRGIRPIDWKSFRSPPGLLPLALEHENDRGVVVATLCCPLRSCSSLHWTVVGQLVPAHRPTRSGRKRVRTAFQSVWSQPEVY